MLGHVDDSDAQARKLIADNELNSAQETAASDANLKAAEATIGVALAEYEGSKKIRERADQAVSEFELRRLQLTHERSVYQAATARVEYAVAQFTRGAKAAQLQAVDNEIARRIITAPLTGVVVDKYHNVGEWAQAGEPLYRIVHMDRFRVEGMVKSDKFMPEQIEGRPVKIFVKTPDGTEEFQGTIDFVNQVVDPSGEFLIHAEFDNPRKPNGQWRVRPGLDAEILILLPRKRPPPPAIASSSPWLGFDSPRTLRPDRHGHACRQPCEQCLAFARLADAARSHGAPAPVSRAVLLGRQGTDRPELLPVPRGRIRHPLHARRRSSLESIKERFELEFMPQKITFQDLQQFVGMLHRSGLVVADAIGQGHQLRKRRDEKKRRELLGKLTNVFAFRWRGIDPEWILNKLYPFTRWFFARPMVIFNLLLACAALLLITVQFDVFRSRLPSFHQFFGNWENWLVMGVVMAGAKVLHEFGHGLSCKHFGGECHELGFMLLVFTPALYCNVSDSWMLPSKWHRAAIGAAGIYVEMVLASIATFIWWFTDRTTLLNQVCLSLMFICSVSTVLFNGNPLAAFRRLLHPDGLDRDSEPAAEVDGGLEAVPGMAVPGHRTAGEPLPASAQPIPVRSVHGGRRHLPLDRRVLDPPVPEQGAGTLRAQSDWPPGRRDRLVRPDRATVVAAGQVLLHAGEDA